MQSIKPFEVISGTGVIVVKLNFTNLQSDQQATSAHLSRLNDNKPNFMDLNVTAGVFMVLMIAIATAILLCCCKTYVMCKKRQQRHRTLEGNHSTRTGLHQHLPIGFRYSDEPPSYADISSAKHKKVASSSPKDCAGTITNLNSEVKNGEENIAVHWSCDDSETDPPLYSCVILESEFNSSDFEVDPPSYHNSVTAPCSGVRIVFGEDTDLSSSRGNKSHKSSASHKMPKSFYNVTSFLKGNKRTASSDNISRSEVDCDNNVISCISAQDTAQPSTSRCVTFHPMA